MYRVLLVEDDEREGRNICSLVERHAATHNVEMRLSWLKSAIDFISSEQRYDLILLDIGLPGISGMEAARLFRGRDRVTSIVFITSLAQYAMQGYEVDALGFVVKPATFAALSLYLDRALKSWQRNTGRHSSIRTEEGTRVIPLEDIIYVEVTDHDLVWHLDGENPIRVRGSLKGVEKDFEDAPVLRISKSHLFNMNTVTALRHGTVTMSSGDELPMSRAHRKQTVGKLTTYLGSRR